ncbi:MAG: 3-hydroxyacyl-ACP dehydratase FabZ [Armatimonadota bacterium]|nr:3-hydroxyacyl-ACP dehydratase FabZ [Armatimonadota bacterium]MDR5697516.1 3-hydroxyacyl-ACP dehydratase FabZ [Armatimonadota bacterium]
MELSIREILRYLPHRYPFLLVDRIVEMDVEAGRIVALKNVTINEEFFTGHLPGRPVMPGVLIIEALAQTAGILALHRLGQPGRVAYFAAVDGLRFRRPVLPGDQLRLEVTLDWIRGRLVRVQGRARVDGQLAAEGTLTFSLSNDEEEA